MIVLKEKQVILEGSRNYSDGLWDIPIYKTDIQNITYSIPKIYPSMHPSRNEELANCTITKKK